MGGSPRSDNKERPSYEDGRLRDPAIGRSQDQGFNRSALLALIRRATRASDDTGGTPANRA